MTHRRSSSHLHLVPGKEADPAVGRPRASALDDAALLAAVRAGDRTVAGVLYERARPQIERTLRRLLRTRDSDWEDLAQLAAIEVITTIDRYRGDCSLDSWIGLLTGRVVYKHIRRRKLERRFFSGELFDESAPDAPAAHTRDASQDDLARRVRTHLLAMDSQKAWVFVLHEVYGYDLTEIAEITGVSASAAQSRLVRGRRDLHQRIAEDPDLAHQLDQGGSQA